jgi:hypothetical protein
MARIGKGTRLISNINSKGDMAYLLFSSVSMTSWAAMPGPEEYLQRGIFKPLDCWQLFGGKGFPGAIRSNLGKNRRKTDGKFPHRAVNFLPRPRNT